MPDDCNSYLLAVKVNKIKFVLCPVYGPNHDDELSFFESLKGRLQRLNLPVMVGGGLECHTG